LFLKEILRKKTGRFQESVYGSANNLVDIHNKGYVDENESCQSSPNEIYFGANNNLSQNEKGIDIRDRSGLEIRNTNGIYTMPIKTQNIPTPEEIADIKFDEKQFNPAIPTNDVERKSSDRIKTKAPTLTVKDGNRLDIFGFKNLNELEDDDDEYENQYDQKSDRFRNNLNRYSGTVEEDKGSQGMGDGTQINSREIPRIRGGAVTQGFMINDRRRKEQRRSTRELSDQQEKQNQEQQQEQEMQSQHHRNMPVHGRYDNMQRAPPMPYHQNYDGQNDMHIPKDEQHMNIVPYGYNTQSDPGQSEQLRTMSEMMNTMFAYQHKNFKTLMDSHTHLMSRIIDKNSPNKDQN
jgi:hypothetical protein